MLELGDLSTFLHISSVGTSSEDGANSHLFVGVCGSDQSTCRVVDKGSELDRDTLYEALDWIVTRYSMLFARASWSVSMLD